MIELMIFANMFISIGCIMLFIMSFININDCKPSTKVIVIQHKKKSSPSKSKY
jgi:hypothetical protein